jgi:hypothetical protein
MNASRTMGFATGALTFILGLALLFTLVGALVGIVLMGAGLTLALLGASSPRP